MADPAFRGFVESTLDALLVFEGCKRGFLPKITRRLQEFEKRAKVVSGAVFVFDEEETGIKRWTDGLSWSPSRTLGNFLVYRELDKKTPHGAGGGGGDDDDGEGGAGGSGGASVRSRLMGGLTSKADPIDEQDMCGGPIASGSGSRPGSSGARRRSSVTEVGAATLDRARERALVGSLTSSYRFRSDGLVKKTISLQGLHLVGYYRIDDVVSGRLRTPSSHQELSALEVSSHFLAPSFYRIPPLVEIGTDGQLKYKGEADAPVSPVTRSGSSQGIPTPAGPQSRPASSSNAPDHFGQVLPPAGSPWDRPLATTPNSPRRAVASSFRSNNRFDPYSSTRISPSHTFTPHAASGYPFPPMPSNQQPPSRAAFLPVGGSALEGGGAYFQERTPPVDGSTSTSAPLAGGGWHGPHAGGLYPPGSSGNDFGADGLPTPGPAFYQPRHSIPYAPTSDASTSAGIFAYNPPPQAGPSGPGAQQYRAPHTATGAYSAYHRPYSAQQHQPQTHALAHAHLPPSSTASSYAPQLSPTNESHSQSPFATPPSTGHPSRAPHPGMLNLSLVTSAVAPSQGGSSLPSPVPPLGGGGGGGGGYAAPHQRLNGAIVEPTSSLSSHAASLMAEVSPHSPADAVGDSRMQQQQQQALRSMYPGGGPGGYAPPPPPPQQQPTSYSPYEQPRAHYGYPAPQQQQQQQQHPSGLVAAVGNEEVVPASGHGLGVSPYGDIVPAGQAGNGNAPSGYGLPPTNGVQHQHQHQHQQQQQQQQRQPSSHGYAPALSHGGGGMYDGPPPHVDERGGGGGWGVKRETPDPHLHQQPLSPPLQPQQVQVQVQVQPGWWGGEDPWQQGVAQRQAQEFQQA